MKADQDSRKRFLLGSVVPFTLVIVALPITPQLIPGEFRGPRVAAAGELIADAPHGRDRNGGEPPIPEKSDALREHRRRDALDVVKRWETEYRRKGGRASISPTDLERLRRALL